MAFATFLLAFLGSIARLGTVLVESDDVMFKFQYIVGCFLNTIIITQFGLYWNNKAQASGKKIQEDKNISQKEKLKRNKIE